MKKNYLKEIENLKKQIEKLQKEAGDNLFGWQKERAEFQNYKRNEEKQRQEIFKIAKEDFILKILKIIDLLEKAFKHLPKENEKSIQNWISGVEHIYHDFKRILAEEGLEEIKSMGQKFDPKLHEAMKKVDPSAQLGTGPSADLTNSLQAQLGTGTKGEEGTIIEEFEKGYTLNGKVLKPAKVVVAKKIAEHRQ